MSTENRFSDPSPQGQSILFRLPLETRWIIYDFVFAEVDTEASLKAFSGVDLRDVTIESATTIRKRRPAPPYWFRPGCTGSTEIHTALLQTCKRMYGEAYMFPIRSKQHKCYHVHGPGVEPAAYLKGFFFHQLRHIRALKIYTQPQSLEEKGPAIRRQLKGVASSLQHLTIVVRNCTLDKNPSAIRGQLLANPFRLGAAQPESMMQDMEASERGENLRMAVSGWAGTFAHLQGLQSLTMEFEHHEGFATELERLARWAQKWRFPLRGDCVLVADSAAKKTWRGLLVHDSTACQRCGRRPGVTRSCSSCQWRKLGRGPRMVTWKVGWKKVEGPIFEDMSVKARPVPRRQNTTSRETADDGLANWDHRLGGLNCILNAPPEAIQQLIDYGIL